VKLLAMETVQYLSYYLSRYKQVEALGVDLYVLNGEGKDDFWPAEKYRIAGSRHIDDLTACASDWHAQERFDGVITFAENSVIAIAGVAEALGLPSIGVPAAVCSRNKYLMRKAYQRAGVPVPSFRLVTRLPEALAAADELGYPVIIKPTMGGGSYFVFRIDSPQELVDKFDGALKGGSELFWATTEADGVDLGPQGMLVESFLAGREYLMEALAWDDEVYLGSVVDRITKEGGTYDDDVHHAPTSMSPADLAEVHRVVKAAAHAQGLRRSAMHAEVRFHDGRPHLLEIAARLGGGGLDLIARLTADYDPVAAVVDVGRGVKPRVRHYQPTGVHMTSMCLISETGGVLEQVYVPPEVSESERTFLLKIVARPGDLVRRPPDGNTVIGFLGVTGTSMQDALATMNAFNSKIKATFATQ